MESKPERLRAGELILRPFEEGDGETAADILLSPEVGRTYLLPGGLDREGALALFRRMMALSRDPGRFVYAVCRAGDLVGWINETERSGGTIELGYVIRPEEWGRGYATAALSCAIRALFSGGFSRVVCGAFEENTASRRVMEKCGMVRAGREEAIEYRGAEHRCIYYEIHAARSERV